MLIKIAVKSINPFCEIHHVFITYNRTVRIMTTAIAILFSTSIFAQFNKADSTYQKVIKDRTAKIVAELNINNLVQMNKVHLQLMNQYFELNSIHDNSKANFASIKANATTTKEQLNEAVIIETTQKQNLLKELHKKFIATLSTTLSTEQVEKVKNSMTYKVLPITWNAYQEMLPQLTKEQKEKMYAWLVEARDLAMDEGSSDAKHAVFGKYKGKINNYLSTKGYNMKAEGEAWAKRIQAAKAKETQN